MIRTSTRRQIAELLPQQGEWTEASYLWLSDGTNRLVELAHGQLEMLPMPEEGHQRILIRIFDLLRAAVEPRGLVLLAPMRLRLAPGLYREPDLMLLRDRRDPRREARAWRGADLALEVVSPSNRAHDLVTKRAEYARAGIPEYWIVDPEPGFVTVLRLPEGGERYVEHGSFGHGDIAASPLLPSLTVDVSSLLDLR